MVHRACDVGIRTGLVALLIFTPLAFGTVEPWSIAAMEWGIVTLVLVFFLARYYPDGIAQTVSAPADRKALFGLAVPIGLFMLLCVAQTVPLPVRWLRVISPGSARLYESVDLASWELAEKGTDGVRRERADTLLRLAPIESRPISVDPSRTWDRLKLLACLVALFFLVANWADQEKAVFLLRWVVVVAFLVSVFGLVQLLTWNGRIYWVRKIPTGYATPPTAFGPFVNHDHFAGYAEMTIPIALSLAFWLIAREARPSSSGGPRAESADRRWATPGGFGEDTGRLSKLSLALFVAVILIVALLFSTSRGGILSAFISGSILLALLCRRAASATLRWTVVVALPVVVVLLISWIGAETIKRQLRTYENLTGEDSFQLRVILWKRMLNELPAYGWVGSGLGTFESSFASLTPAGSMKRWDKAHNDYLQLLWESGVVGGLLFLAGLVLYVKRYWWPALRGSSQPLDFFRIGLAAALLSIALHSVVDFCLQIGANGFLCTMLAGVLVALHRVAATGGLSGGRAQPIEGPWAD